MSGHLKELGVACNNAIQSWVQKGSLKTTSLECRRRILGSTKVGKNIERLWRNVDVEAILA